MEGHHLHEAPRKGEEEKKVKKKRRKKNGINLLLKEVKLFHERESRIKYSSIQAEPYDS